MDKPHKTMRHTILSLLLALPLAAAAQQFEANGITYEVMRNYSGSVAVVRGTKTYSGTINLPSSVSYNGTSYAVRAIAAGAFGDSYISSISFPYSLSEIGADAFKNCRNLWDIKIPTHVERLGAGSFEGCTSLTNVEFGYSNMRELPSRLFAGCQSLRSVRMPPYITSIGDNCFRDCRSLANISIPNRVEAIGASAFQGCRALSSINLPSQVRRIGSYAFGGCYVLKTITCESRAPYAIYETTAFRGDGTDLYRSAKLCVPRGSLQQYKQTAGWREFQKIEEQ